MPIRARLFACAGLLLASLPPARAGETAPPDHSGKEWELRGVETNLKTSEEERRKIEADVEAIKLDRTRLNEALLETTSRLQKTEADRADAVARLTKSAADEAALEKSVAARRDRIAELLAALQRLTRNTPPAIFVARDDMVSAVRSAEIVGGLIRDVKRQSDALGADLAHASELGRDVEDQRRGLETSAEQLALDQTRLAALIDARQKALADRESALADEARKANQLAQQAGSLKDLISRMDGAAAASSAAERAAALTKGPSAATRALDPAKLGPAVAFAEMKGRLPWPVAGPQVKSFGDPDGYGGQLKGVSVSAAPGAAVAAPVDAWVAFAGPYRSYGQLLILNAGEGYYLVLAGMERIQVSVGQFVLAGEPVAAMGARAAPGASIGAEGPVLYIELRKNDAVIDPQTWWAKPNLEKARG